MIESPLWGLVRDFLSSADVLEMCTTGHKWNTARLFGSFAELFFSFEKKKTMITLSPSQSGPVCVTITVKYTDSTMGGLNLWQLQDLTALGSSAECSWAAGSRVIIGPKRTVHT